MFSKLGEILYLIIGYNYSESDNEMCSNECNFTCWNEGLLICCTKTWKDETSWNLVLLTVSSYVFYSQETNLIPQANDLDPV